VVVCELVLVELYLKLRNERIFPRPLSASQATAACQSYRQNRLWKIVEAAPVMENVWKSTGEEGFAFRRIIDLRLGMTLLHSGVTHFATSNVRDFQNLGFEKVWNPLCGDA
jgi:predicted nucleic acid-binding protein